MSRKLNFGLLLLVVALVSISGASAFSGIPGWYDPNGGGTHTTSNPTPEACTGCHNEGGAPVCTACHSNPFTLTVVANPTTVTVGTPASVNFAVTRKNSMQGVGNVAVDLSGAATGSGTTLPAGTVDINVNANSAGTIIANATRTGYESGTATVTATEVTPTPVLETIMVSPPTATLSIGDTQVFTATALDENGDPMEGINITLASSDNAVGTVSPENVITGADGNSTTTFTAIANGTAMVTASNDSVSGSANVTVSEAVIAPNLTITVSPSTAALFIGDTQEFTATALDENSDPMEGINIEWASSDIAVGTVSPESVMTDANGTATTTFTAIANGTATVTATNGSVVGSAEVVVNEEIVEVNLIKNPGFESGKQNWIFYTNGTGKFNIISPGFEGNNASEVMLGKIGSNIQLYQKELTLKPDTHYRLSFAAKSSRGHDVRVVLLKHGSPYTNYGLKQGFNLTRDWQTFTTEFDTKGFAGTVDDGRLMFYLAPYAKAGDKYYFDSVVLEEETE